MKAFEKGLIWLESRPGLTISIVGSTAFLINAALSLFGYFPKPEVHDEFSYLLAADTFARGRLTNPTHPMWVHFESIHINQFPTYASMYPPGQGLFLALGKVMTGYPIAGAWLGVAFGCAAITWMLFAWVPVRWAMLGGAIAVFHPLILAWGQSYWGGGVAMIGGALLLGAFRRFVVAPGTPSALIMGIGIAILANTRPYEGLILTSLLCAGLTFFALRRNCFSARILLKRLVLPLSAVLLPSAIWMGYYNYRVAGDPLQLPRVINHRAYMVAPIFLWQRPAPEPVYRHRALRDFHVGWEMSDYLGQTSFKGLAFYTWEKLKRLGREYLSSWGLAIPLIMLPALVKRDCWMRIAGVVLVVFVIALLMVFWLLAHYAAPVMGLFLAVTLGCMRLLWAWQWNRRAIGRWCVGVAVSLSLLSGILRSVELAGSETGEPSLGILRAHIISRFEELGGKHLIVVRYRPEHNPHLEWVYNEADINSASIVWARDMDEEQNRKLLNYFQDRHVWLFEADDLRMRLLN